MASLLSKIAKRAAHCSVSPAKGDVFVHGGRADDDLPLDWGKIGFATSLEEISAWAQGKRVQRPNITQRDQESSWQYRALALPCKMTLGGQCGVVSQDQAVQR